MRYHYATVHQCDACGKTATVPEPCDLRTLTYDPRPVGWGLPKQLALLMLDHREGNYRIDDICSDCMTLPLDEILRKAKARANEISESR